MNSDKKFFFAYFLIFGLGLLGTAIFNYAIDPAHIFRPGIYEMKIAESLAKPSHIIAKSNYDERLVQKYWINHLKQIPPGVVLGSSRMMQVGLQPPDPSLLTNHSVSGATLEDIVGIWSMLNDRKPKPDKVIIGIDPWMLNPQNNQHRWQSIRMEFQKLVHAWNLPGRNGASSQNHLAKWRELISGAYLRQGWESLKKQSSNKDDITLTTQTEGPEAIIRFDGTLCYQDAFRHQKTSEARQKAIEYARKRPIYSLKNFFEPGKKEVELLEVFLRNLNHHADILLVLVPYHPEVYRAIKNSRDTAGVALAEQTVLDIAKRLNIETVGSYDPNQIGFSEDDFYDGMHVRTEAMMRLLRVSKLFQLIENP